METYFNNRVLNKDLKEIIANNENYEFSLGTVGGNSIEVYDKLTQAQGSYLYGKNIKHRDEDYTNLLDIIEFKLVN
jgi:hypothetical protein